MAGQQVYGTITPADGTVLAPALIAIWVTTAGNLAIRGKGDTNSVVIPVTLGLLSFPYPVDKVLATGTTAVVSIGVAAG